MIKPFAVLLVLALAAPVLADGIPVRRKKRVVKRKVSKTVVMGSGDKTVTMGWEPVPRYVTGPLETPTELTSLLDEDELLPLFDIPPEQPVTGIGDSTWAEINSVGGGSGEVPIADDDHKGLLFLIFGGAAAGGLVAILLNDNDSPAPPAFTPSAPQSTPQVSPVPIPEPSTLLLGLIGLLALRRKIR